MAERAEISDRESLTAAIDRVTKAEPPPIVYHYTTAAGLIGTLQSGVLWATHSDFLNDQQECRHGLAVAAECLDRRERDGVADEPFHSLVRGAIKFADEAWFNRPYLASFSACDDSLTQWAMYSAGGQGVAIGFDSSWLRTKTKANARLLPCVYTADDHRALMEEFLSREQRRAVQRFGPPPWESQFFYSEIAGALSVILPLVKHHAFRQEEEWRLIATGMRVHAREARGSVVPYVKIPIRHDDAGHAVKRIVIGPAADKTRAARALDRILKLAEDSSQYPCVEIGESDLPYRG